MLRQGKMMHVQTRSYENVGCTIFEFSLLGYDQSGRIKPHLYVTLTRPMS